MVYYVLIKKPSNKKLILCIIGGVVVVGVVGTGAYYWYKSYKNKQHADVKIVNKIADILDVIVELDEEDLINLGLTIAATSIKATTTPMPTTIAETRQSLRELIQYARATVLNLRSGKNISEEVSANINHPQTQALFAMQKNPKVQEFLKILPVILTRLPDIKNVIKDIDIENINEEMLRNPRKLMPRLVANPAIFGTIQSIMADILKATPASDQSPEGAPSNDHEFDNEHGDKSDSESYVFHGTAEEYEFNLGDDGRQDSDQTAREEREKAHEAVFASNTFESTSFAFA